ncbi:hypothetical protein BS50DRAFT_593938 [Corynespora cassiicola Philippines]|uniref:Uncharacterized protein n=1 Tax=Corynespora cassiicola Philippines TaxID=1448308 RepID=A0A2T2N569_CORCC|nr:hypothetical protein BS50DRAFT_593938 [Corynespora cassiicola Philippines]
MGNLSTCRPHASGSLSIPLESLLLEIELNTQTDPTHRIIAGGMKAHTSLAYIFIYWARPRPIASLLIKFRKGTTQMIEAFHRSLLTIIENRMSVPIDAIYEFYSLASEKIGSGELGTISKEFWSEAALFTSAGMPRIETGEL